MSIATDKAILRTRFLDQFDSSVQRTVDDNAPAKDVDRTRPWVNFCVRPNASKRTTFGAGRQEAFGLVYLQVFVPLGLGTNEADTIVDQFVGIFRDWRSPDADFWVGEETVRNVPSSDYYQVNVMLPYTSNS